MRNFVYLNTKNQKKREADARLPFAYYLEYRNIIPLLLRLLQIALQQALFELQSYS